MPGKLFVMMAAASGLALAQEGPLDPYGSVKINLPDSSPVSILGANYADSRATARGGALLLDLHMSLTLRNQDSRRIRGITLLIAAQESAPGGRASWSAPTLDVKPGETFPVNFDVQLIRPLQNGTGPLVQVSLDGVLFEGLDFYGPNRLNSRRTMTFWEAQNQRDRHYFKQVLSARGVPGLQQEILDSLSRQLETPAIDVRMARGGRSVAGNSGASHLTKFAFLQTPDAPVEARAGWVEVSGDEARDARISVHNLSRAPVRYVEIGWAVKDREGRQYLAGSVPASENDLYLPPNATGKLLQDTALRFARGKGQPLNIEGMTAFVSQVEFTDGHVWVPSRESMTSSGLNRLMPPSPEEQRLTDLYRKKGMDAVLKDLARY